MDPNVLRNVMAMQLADGQRPTITNRGMLVPRVEYSDGTQGWGVPGLLMEPVEAWQRLQAGAGENVARMQQGLLFDRQAAGDAFSVVGGAAVGNAVPQVARSLANPAVRGAGRVPRFADDAIDMEAVAPGHGFGSGSGTPATNWTPWSKAYPDPQQSPHWPSSWGDDVSAAEKTAFAKSEYLRGLWREEMNKRWSPDWDRPMVERDVMDAYPGLGEAMRQADAEFAAIRKGMPVGSDPWANDPYAWFNRPHELGQPDPTVADVAGHMADSMRQEAARSRPAPKPAGLLDFFSNPKEAAALNAAIQGEKSAGGFASHLPMDEASRMARALEMGFDTDATWYHGSKSDFGAFDASRLGVNSGELNAFSFSSAPSVADSYAGMSSYVKWDADFDAALKDAFARAHGQKQLRPGQTKADAVSEHKALVDQAYRNDPAVWNWVENYMDGANVRPVFIRAGKQMQVDANGDLWKSIGSEKTRIQDIVERAKKDGYDSVLVKNVRDAGSESRSGQVSDSLFVFDPRNIRSKYAAFDPAKADSADLLAANPKEAAALNAAIQGERQAQDDALLEILRKYGVAGGMSLLGLSQQLGQQDTY